MSNEARRQAPGAKSNDGLPEIEIVEAEIVEESTSSPEELGLDLPEDPAQALQIVLEALVEARKEANSYLDDLRRVAADFDNYRKRTQRELSSVVERAAERVVRALVPVLDSFEAALGAVEPKTDNEEKLLAGMRNIYSQLLEGLAKEGLERIATWDEPFDPVVHDAVVHEGDSTGPLIVYRELRPGYMLRGKVLRAASVAVGPDKSDSQRAQGE